MKKMVMVPGILVSLLVLLIPVLSMNAQSLKKQAEKDLMTLTMVPDNPFQPKNNGYYSPEAWVVNQDFEGTTFPPTGWSLAGSANLWSRSTAASGYGVGIASARADFYNVTSGSQDLITLTFTPSVAGDSLRFDHAYATYQSEVDQLVISTSTNGGTSWTTLVTLNGGVSGPLNTGGATTSPFVPTASQWATKRYALPVGTNKIRFTAVSAYGNQLYIDNIMIGQPSANDVGVLSIDMNNAQPGIIAPKATVKNFGTVPQTFNVQMVISPGGYSSTMTVTNLAAGASQQVTFSNWNPSLGTYLVTVYTQLAGDQNTANDTLSKSVIITNDLWVSGANMPTGNESYMGYGATYFDGTHAWLFCVGGNAPGGQNKIVKYNISTNTWVTGLANNSYNTVVNAAAVLGNYVYVIGGHNGSAYINTVSRYNITANSWSTVAPLPSVLGWCDAVSYKDSLIYVVGGYNGSAYQNTVYIYSIHSNTWRTGTSMPVAIMGGALAIKGDTLVYVGGSTGTLQATTYMGVINPANPSQITWSTRANYPGGPMYRFDAATWGSQGIIVAGGSPTIAWTPANPNPCYVFKPGANVWVQLENLPTPVLGAYTGSVRLPNGDLRFVLASGYTGSAITTATQVYRSSEIVNEMPTAFNLLQPADNSRIPVHSSSTESINAVWSKSVDPEGQPITYTFVIDQSPTFGATKVELPSNNSGLDTVITISKADLDAYANFLGVTRGDSILLYWKVMASDGVVSRSSNQIWTIRVVRENYLPSAFDLLSPPNAHRKVVSALNNTPFTFQWERSVDPESEPVIYTWVLDSSMSFGFTTWTESTGTDTQYTFPTNLLDAYVSNLGVAPGDSIILYWRVMASDGFNNIFSSSVYSLRVVRELLANNPPTPANLLTPANGARVHVYPNIPGNLSMTWKSSKDPEGSTVHYTVYWDILPTFNSPVVTSMPSNNNGLDTVRTTALSDLEDWVESLGVGFNDSVIVYWKVVSTDGTYNINSMQTFEMNVVRTLPPPTVIFFDNFESGTGNWTLQGTWGLSTVHSYSPTRSLSESPTGNYGNNLNISATLTNGLNLSTALDATLSFWGRYVIETGFDTMYVEVSTNGTTWIPIGAFSGEDPPSWKKYTYSLGGFVGNNSVKIRFRFFSDGYYTVDGMYIDDVEVSISDYDASAPLITHTGPEFYQGTINARQVVANIVDISGIYLAELKYKVDNGITQTVAPDSNNGSTYYFTIPGLPAGSWVKYWIEATDNSADHNFGRTPDYEYISGNYIAYDNPTVDYVTNFPTNTGAAVKIDVPAGFKARLVTALIRNYTDISRPNDSMIVHVWADQFGFPGADLITPFKVKPEATLTNTSPMTRIDLRPYAAQLSNLTSFHIGFTVPDGDIDTVWITIKQPGTNGRASVFNGTTWSAPTQPTDYHFRAILDTLKPLVGIADQEPLPARFELYRNYPNPFNPTTTIRYDLKEKTKVTLKVYNMLGQEVRTLVNSVQNAGSYQTVWDGKNNAGVSVSSGIYVYRLQAGNFVKSHKMVFMK